MHRLYLRLLAVATALALTAHASLAEDVTPIRLDAGTDAATYCGRVLDAIMLEDYAALEATADRARTLSFHFPGGKAELQVFYESFAKESCGKRYLYLTEEVGKSRVALMERWLGQKPDSQTAKIASAMVWSQFAWAGRGTGFANQVSKEQWAMFSERISHAVELMKTVDPDRDAQAYLVLLHLVRDLGVERPQIDSIFRHARDRFPTYLSYYADYASILLPKWYGQPGDLAAYMATLLSEPGGDVGAMAYSRAAERLAWDMKSTDIFRDAGLTWENVRHGFALRESRDGLEKTNWTTLCYFAVMAGDRAAAREAYSHVTDLDEWPDGGSANFFRQVLPWIMQRD